jgi:uncharacterized membrane protein YjjP (DUF1212 family)/uncharacterized membrane protein YjjB (DUF3815 family)
MTGDTNEQHADRMSSLSGEDEEVLGVEVVLALGTLLISTGSSTRDAEHAMRSTAAAIGLSRATAAVSFNVIALSYFPVPTARPITAINLVPQRVDDYQRLSAAATLASSLRSGAIGLGEAAAALWRMNGSTAMPSKWLGGLAQAASAAALTVVFGGTGTDALATMLVSTLVQPVVMGLDRFRLPPFFRSLIGPLVAALFVAGTVAVDAPINPSLVLAGSMLQFLPGAALVAGMRDLIDQSIVSGSARLAEALLLGGAVASGTAIGIGLAGTFGVAIEVGIAIGESSQLPIQVLAAAAACGSWALHLGQRRFALLAASAIGATGWFIYAAATQFGSDSLAATALAGLVIGGGGQVLTGRSDTPVVLRVVPASYPLLPGLLIVSGMLSATPTGGLILLSTAAATALALGAAVAFGGTLVQPLRRIHHRTEPIHGLESSLRPKISVRARDRDAELLLVQARAVEQGG